MLENEERDLMPPEKMIEMFTHKIISNQSIEHIAAKVPDGCEHFNFALLHTYIYHDIVESKGFPIDRKVYI